MSTQSEQREENQVAASIEAGAPPPPFSLSEAAITQMQAALSAEAAPGQGIRLAVVGGGCAGFQYAMNFESKERPGDTHFEQGGVEIYVDKMSITYLAGCEVDFARSAMGAGFKFNNPNVTTTCGCGSSFS